MIQSVLSLSTVGSLVDQRAYKSYTLVGPPVLRPVLAPLAVNSSTTVYIYLVLMCLQFRSCMSREKRILSQNWSRNLIQWPNKGKNMYRCHRRFWLLVEEKLFRNKLRLNFYWKTKELNWLNDWIFSCFIFQDFRCSKLSSVIQLKDYSQMKTRRKSQYHKLFKT